MPDHKNLTNAVTALIEQTLIVELAQKDEEIRLLKFKLAAAENRCGVCIRNTQYPIVPNPYDHNRPYWTWYQDGVSTKCIGVSD